ncbi:unnamed protein product [Strongylus vulgaris]|uniref:Chloride channel protein n=1 Tax=Strongylus vulgaris TaxID=40348 RepID=A0A3P7LBI7_STRVU|nr:unnamed protein product [Strongylus vulgaris]
MNFLVQALTYPSDENEKVEVWTWILSFVSWCAYTVGLTCASATFTHYVSQQAIGRFSWLHECSSPKEKKSDFAQRKKTLILIRNNLRSTYFLAGFFFGNCAWVIYNSLGSGIPEMKTIIRGVRLKDYLTFPTLVSKVGGLAMALGSGIPIGKMVSLRAFEFFLFAFTLHHQGPFVHLASVVSNQLAILASKFDSAFASETRRTECLVAGCAVGVACTFSAPVGVTVNAFFQTSFSPDAFVVDEIPLFVLLGIVCGVLGALYITLYRSVVMFLRNNKYAKRMFQQNWIVYPVCVSFAYSVVSFPLGLGMFSTGRVRLSISNNTNYMIHA